MSYRSWPGDTESMGCCPGPVRFHSPAEGTIIRASNVDSQRNELLLIKGSSPRSRNCARKVLKASGERQKGMKPVEPALSRIDPTKMFEQTLQSIFFGLASASSTIASSSAFFN
mmetsp:Transcript_24600/g.50521  ORF Transcript_24600/g.50521 Transcript_24600/m.50521 type:complete len:114 (-) Transcript_24600:717-1058(-)